MWEFVDKVIYINLDSRQDRRDIMTTFFEKAQIPLEKVERFAAIKTKKGQIGCLMSHTEVLRKAKRERWKNVLILEDDLEVLDFEEGYKQLEELVKLPNWDVIMLVGWYWKYDFPRIFNANNTGAYLVNSSYYDTLLHNRETALLNSNKTYGFNFNTRRNDADVSWKLIQVKDNWYGIHPCLCRQVDGISDISGKEIKSSLVYGIGTMEVKKQVYGR
jgi:glycosyl transferase family 25